MGTENFDDFKVKLGLVLREFRKYRTDLSQSEMGEKIGMTQKGVSNIESGKTLANAYVLYKYCEICKVTPNQIFERLTLKLK